MSISVALLHNTPKQVTPTFILNLTKAILVDTSASVTVYVKGKKDKFIICHLNQKFPEFSPNLSFAPSEPVEFLCVAAKAPAKPDETLVHLLGADTPLVPAPNHLQHWALPSDQSDSEESDHQEDWRLDLAEAQAAGSDDSDDADMMDKDDEEEEHAHAHSHGHGHKHHHHHHHHDHDHKHDHKHEDGSKKKRKREEEPAAASPKASSSSSSASPKASQKKSPASPSAVPDAKRPKKEFQKIKLIKPQIRKHPLGVQITERVMTDGPVAKTGKVVTIKYECKLPTGEQIDAGERTFRLGVGEVLRGWDYGMEGMRVGSERSLVVPKDLAYSTQNTVPVPEKAKKATHLEFDIELVNIA